MTTLRAEQILERRPMAMRRMFALFKRGVFFLVLGAVISILMAWALGMWAEPSTATPISAAARERGKIWEVNTWNSTGAMRIYSKRQAQAYSGYQVTGPPDAVMGNDSSKAWCPATADAQVEWLVLDYPEPIDARQVEIHENYYPGAASRVTAFNEAGGEVELWRGQDPTAEDAGSGVSKIPLPSTTTKIRRIKIYFNSPRVPGWNEIDAVGLTDRDGKTWWAIDVQDSSSYANSMISATSGATPGELMPGWCPARNETMGGQEERVFEARGWPMLAMWTERMTGSVAGAQAGSAGYMRGATPGVAYVGLSPVLPTRPIWVGLLVDSLFYAGVMGVGVWGLTRPRKLVRELARMRSGCCVECGYDLDFDFRGGCPECGWRRMRPRGEEQ